MIIRKLRAIVFGIKRDAERERRRQNEQTGNDMQAQAVQKPAC